MIKRKIFILLLHFSDIGSLAMQYCTDFYYTHASIGLEESSCWHLKSRHLFSAIRVSVYCLPCCICLLNGRVTISVHNLLQRF